MVVFFAALAATAVKSQIMVDEFKAHAGSDFLLMAFDFGVMEFFYAATTDADNVVVVRAFIEFVDCFPCFKIIS